MNNLKWKFIASDLAKQLLISFMNNYSLYANKFTFLIFLCIHWSTVFCLLWTTCILVRANGFYKSSMTSIVNVLCYSLSLGIMSGRHMERSLMKSSIWVEVLLQQEWPLLNMFLSSLRQELIGWLLLRLALDRTSKVSPSFIQSLTQWYNCWGASFCASVSVLGFITTYFCLECHKTGWGPSKALNVIVLWLSR